MKAAKQMMERTGQSARWLIMALMLINSIVIVIVIVTVINHNWYWQMGDMKMMMTMVWSIM